MWQCCDIKMADAFLMLCSLWGSVRLISQWNPFNNLRWLLENTRTYGDKWSNLFRLSGLKEKNDVGMQPRDKKLNARFHLYARAHSLTVSDCELYWHRKAPPRRNCKRNVCWATFGSISLVLRYSWISHKLPSAATPIFVFLFMLGQGMRFVRLRILSRQLSLWIQSGSMLLLY